MSYAAVKRIKSWQPARYIGLRGTAWSIWLCRFLMLEKNLNIRTMNNLHTKKIVSNKAWTSKVCYPNLESPKERRREKDMCKKKKIYFFFILKFRSVCLQYFWRCNIFYFTTSYISCKHCKNLLISCNPKLFFGKQCFILHLSLLF